MQIKDRVRHRKIDFAMVAANGTGLFDPKKYGIPVRWLSSACWRGYFARYEINKGELVLKTACLGINLPDHLLKTEHPEFSISGVVPKREDETYGCWYRNLNLGITFSGGMVLGDEFQSKTYFYLGLHPAWQYGQVRELIFEDGRLKSEVDLSDAITAMRLKILSERNGSETPDYEKIDKSIQGYFSLDYLGRGA